MGGGGAGHGDGPQPIEKDTAITRLAARVAAGASLEDPVKSCHLFGRAGHARQRRHLRERQGFIGLKRCLSFLTEHQHLRERQGFIGLQQRLVLQDTVLV